MACLCKRPLLFFCPVNFKRPWVLTQEKYSTLNPLTSVSHWSGFKVKLTFHGIQFFGSSLYTEEFYAYKLICS